jgi:hypothetical protein
MLAKIINNEIPKILLVHVDPIRSKSVEQLNEVLLTFISQQSAEHRKAIHAD